MSTRIDGAACQIIPDDLYTSGEPSLNRLAAAAGDRFDVWQRQINRIILAKSADGFWSARNAVLSIPRQTGKTYDIGWVAIHRAARTPGPCGPDRGGLLGAPRRGDLARRGLGGGGLAGGELGGLVGLGAGYGGELRAGRDVPEQAGGLGAAHGHGAQHAAEHGAGAVRVHGVGGDGRAARRAAGLGGGGAEVLETVLDAVDARCDRGNPRHVASPRNARCVASSSRTCCSTRSSSARSASI